MPKAYWGSGSTSYHPALLLGSLIYGEATGVHASRKIERASDDSVALRYIAANDLPDHDTIATFRRRFAAKIKKLVVDVLVLARELGMLQMGTIAIDGTNIHANASRHCALSYEHAAKLEAQHKVDQLATRTGKKLYGLPKHTPEPVFGIIKSVMAFRQFSMCGLDKVKGEWSLVSLA